ncbi:MAG: HNH endonuclease [Panacibacter sp.]
MYFNEELIDMQFQKFTDFVERKKNIPFKKFSHPYIEEHENYKYEVYDKARENLRLIDKQLWKESNIGKGQILERVISAIEFKENNLLQWDNRYGDTAKQHKFLLIAKREKKNLIEFERIFFDLYKRTIDKECFDNLLNFIKDYRLISYFFFIKQKGDNQYMIKDRYLPIVPTTFDKIFEKIGVTNYKASGNCSYENYCSYINIVKNVREYLLKKIASPLTILDAHSFLWILGNQMEEDKKKEKDNEKKVKVNITEIINNASLLNQDEIEKDNEQASIEEAINDNVDETVLAEIRVRRGQQALRNNLLELYKGRCCITGCEIKEILHACHINPHSECGNNSVKNALLLRSDIHDLFDSHLLGINPKTLTIHLNKKLSNSEYKDLEGEQILPPNNEMELNNAALKIRWELFSDRNAE